MTLFNRIVNLLIPHLPDKNARQALLMGALFGCPVLDHIEWDGDARTFTTLMVRKLLDYGDCPPGEPAPVLVLRELRGQVGMNKHAEIDQLIQELSTPQPKTKGQNMALEPGILMGFLLEIGRWAKSELRERWKLRRDQQTADLTKKAEVDATVPKMLQAAANASSAKRVQETIDLIERKRDAINRARNAKLADREQLDRQEILQSAFEQLEKKHNRTIQQMMDEIEADLNDLGFDVEREPV